jgi:hypothetical protein
MPHQTAARSGSFVLPFRAVAPAAAAAAPAAVAPPKRAAEVIGAGCRGGTQRGPEGHELLQRRRAWQARRRAWQARGLLLRAQQRPGPRLLLGACGRHRVVKYPYNSISNARGRNARPQLRGRAVALRELLAPPAPRARDPPATAASARKTLKMAYLVIFPRPGCAKLRSTLQPGHGAQQSREHSLVRKGLIMNGSIIVRFCIGIHHMLHVRSVAWRSGAGAGGRPPPLAPLPSIWGCASLTLCRPRAPASESVPALGPPWSFDGRPAGHPSQAWVQFAWRAWPGPPCSARRMAVHCGARWHTVSNGRAASRCEGAARRAGCAAVGRRAKFRSPWLLQLICFPGAKMSAPQPGEPLSEDPRKSAGAGAPSIGAVAQHPPGRPLPPAPAGGGVRLRRDGCRISQCSLAAGLMPGLLAPPGRSYAPLPAVARCCNLRVGLAPSNPLHLTPSTHCLVRRFPLARGPGSEAQPLQPVQGSVATFQCPRRHWRVARRRAPAGA